MKKVVMKRRCQRMLREYEINQDIKGSDLSFLKLLIDMHHRKDKKIGCGIAGMRVIRTIFNKRGFQIIRTDGSTTDFSYLECLSPKSKKIDLRQACRQSIFKRIMRFKMNILMLDNVQLCPITKEELHLNNSEVHHCPPYTFEKIFKEWIKNEDISKLEIVGYEDNEMIKRFKNPNISSDFLRFHNQFAKLQLLSVNGHKLTRKTK